MVTPVAAGLLFIQGLAQCCRCIICLKTGEWPQHLEDVEEMETMMLHAHEEEGQTKATLGIGREGGER